FLGERPAIAELQKVQLADDSVEAGPNAAPFAASLLEERMECENFIRIHRVVVRGQSPAMLGCQLSNADDLAAVAEGDIADEATEYVESLFRQFNWCVALARNHFWLTFHEHSSGQPRRRGPPWSWRKKPPLPFNGFFFGNPGGFRTPGGQCNSGASMPWMRIVSFRPVFMTFFPAICAPSKTRVRRSPCGDPFALNSKPSTLATTVAVSASGLPFGQN